MKRSLYKDEMDLLLYAAMPYVISETEESIPNAPSALSEKEKHQILRNIRRAGTHNGRQYRTWKECLKYTAVIVLIVLSLGFVSTMSIEAVRVAVWETIVEWYEEKIYFAYQNVGDTDIPDRILEYKEPVLAGWIRYEAGKTEYNLAVEYEREGDLITYTQNLLDDYDVFLSNHNTEMKDIVVNGYPGIVSVFTTEGVTVTTIIWHDNEYVYKMSSDLSYEELLKRAESIK